MSKQVSLFGGLSYFLLLFLSILYYQERTIFLDTAYHLFSIVKQGDFAFQHYRYGAVLTQWVPVLMSKMNASLNLIMMAYSATFVLYSAAAFFLSLYVFKSPRIALVIILFDLLLTTHTFYWIVSEYRQGLIFCLAFYAKILSEKDSGFLNKISFKQALNLLLLIALSYFHPLIILTVIFISGFLWLGRELDWKSVLRLNVVFVAINVVKSNILKSEYNDTATLGLRNFKQLFPNYFDIQSNHDLINWFSSDYYIFLIAFGSIVAFYLTQAHYLKLCFLICSVAGYLVLVNIVFPESAPQFYMENLYLPISLFVAFAFATDLYPKLKLKYIYLILGLVFVIRTHQIGINHKPYTERLEWMKNFMPTEDKMIVDEGKVPLETLKMTWGASYEFWLLSTSESGTSRSVMITNNTDDYLWMLSDSNSFVSLWGIYPYGELPIKYFNFKNQNRYKIYTD